MLVFMAMIVFMDDHPPRSGLQARLAELRSRSKLSGRRLAELAQLKSPSHFNLIESGDRPTPSAQVLHAIARTLGTTVEYLLTGEGEAPTEEQLARALAAAEQRLEADHAATRAA